MKKKNQKIWRLSVCLKFFGKKIVYDKKFELNGILGRNGWDGRNIFSTTVRSRSWLTDWGVDWLADWLTGWLTDISLALNSSYRWVFLCIKNAVSFTFSKSWFFSLKFTFIQKTTLVFNYPRNAFKRPCRNLHIDTTVHFHRHII